MRSLSFLSSLSVPEERTAVVAIEVPSPNAIEAIVVLYLKHLFDTADSDGDGTVEIAHVCESLKCSKEIQQVFGAKCRSGTASGKGSTQSMPAFFVNQTSSLDLDGCRVSFQEFKAHFFPKIRGSTNSVASWATLWRIFNDIDANCDGQIDVTELKDALRDSKDAQQLFGIEYQREVRENHLGRKIIELVNTFDTNKSGIISWQDFKRYMKISPTWPL